MSSNRQIEIDGAIPLGEGGYGKVFPGKYNGRKVAVKRVDLYQVSDIEEIALLKLDHPNIIKLLHSENDDSFKYFAFELCEASLDQLFLKDNHRRKYKGPKLPHHLTIFLQLASGLEYIHDQKFFHRDIKPENVLIYVDSAGLVTIKWADFGLSKIVNERGTCTLSEIKGTRNWLAPEVLRNLETSQEPERGTVKSDVFVLGLLFGFLLLGGQHLYGSNESEIRGNIEKKTPVNMDQIDGLHYAHHLLPKMLEDEPEKRISSLEVANKLNSVKIEVKRETGEITAYSCRLLGWSLVKKYGLPWTAVEMLPESLLTIASTKTIPASIV